MFGNPSLTTRIAVGKLAGFAIGLIGFFTIPYFWADAPWTLRWGILFWYATVGAFVGFIGVYTWHPILKLHLPWWLSAATVGAWMNFVLTFFAFDVMKTMLVNSFGENGTFTSPFWFVAEGAIVGLIIGYLATKFGGEGPATVEQL